MSNAISVDKLLRKKFTIIKLNDALEKLMGNLECSGSVLIYGDSGNGKTTFSLQLAKALCQTKKVGYNSIEEKAKYSFQQAIKKANILSVKSKFKLWVSLTVEELIEELSKKKSPDVVFIDSIQYLRMSEKSSNELTKFEYKDLINMFPNKLFIWISHEKNGEPKGALADAVYYDSDTCIQVCDYVASPVKSRLGGKEPYNI